MVSACTRLFSLRGLGENILTFRLDGFLLYSLFFFVLYALFFHLLSVFFHCWLKIKCTPDEILRPTQQQEGPAFSDGLDWTWKDHTKTYLLLCKDPNSNLHIFLKEGITCLHDSRPFFMNCVQYIIAQEPQVCLRHIVTKVMGCLKSPYSKIIIVFHKDSSRSRCF